MKKVAIITGADGGMGQVHTKAVALAGYEVVMACRDIEKSRKCHEKLLAETKQSISLLPLDLASFTSITAFVAEIKQRYTHIDLLLNNAGTLCHQAQTTEDGIEYTVGVNYLGHYFLTHQLIGLMPSGSRIVNMVSLTLRYGKITDNLFQPIAPDHFNRFIPYSNSKLALLYFTLDAAEQWKEKGVLVNCADPGIVSTNIIRQGNAVIDKLCDIFFRPIIRKPEKGAETMLYLALNQDITDTGGCYKDKKQIQLKPELLHSQRRIWLRKKTEEMVEQILKNKK